MNTETPSATFARRLVENLKKQGLLGGEAQKDNLTDLVHGLPVPPPSTNGGDAGGSSRAPGTVVANDGTIVTLGQERNTTGQIPSSPGRT